jgi:DNA-binding MarR family transcriptional regulator
MSTRPQKAIRTKADDGRRPNGRASGDPSPVPELGRSPEGERRLDVGPLRSYVGYAIRRAQLAVFQNFLKVMAAVELRPAQFAVLTIMEASPGLKQSQICELLDMKRANFVALFDDLEKRGLAERAPAPGDRRSNALFLTKKGKAFLARANRLHEDHEALIVQRIGAEGKQQLLDLLERLSTMKA